MSPEAYVANLINYGALGVISVYLMWQLQQQKQREDQLLEKLEGVISSNTIALTKFHDVLEDVAHKEEIEHDRRT